MGTSGEQSSEGRPEQDGVPPPRRTVPVTERTIIERVRASRPGDAIVRLHRPRFAGFDRRGPGHLEASIEIEAPRGLFGWARRLLVGEPIHRRFEARERLTKKKALAVFSSDALSSVAYTPQETLVVLLAAGVGALVWSLPIAIAVVALLAIVVTSYRQTIHAYPSGGGSYIVARTNLGPIPGLIAASALSVGYILTVAVSISASVDQLVSAAPVLLPFRVWLGIGAIALVTLANLRGIRESGSIFAAPTYVFVIAMYALIAAGLIRLATGTLVVPPPAEAARVVLEPFSIFLLLRAFAISSAVMTGTEAISDGIPAFKPPEPTNAARTLVSMAVILGTMFLGLAILITGAGVIPSESETVISQLARAVFGSGPLYLLVQVSAVLILVLAANTAYADFPRLASFLARDDYLPHQLAFRGDRLAFSNGILLLGVFSAVLVLFFGGSTGALLPLYALSVFIAFTLSQLGMVQHWRRVRGERWRSKACVNGIGAALTGAVVLIAGITNFVNPGLPIAPGLPIGWGSWLVLVTIPAMLWIFLKIHRHYQKVAAATALPPTPTSLREIRHEVVVPISRLNWPTVRALQYARTLAEHVTAVHVASDPERAAEIESQWQTWGQGIPLIIVESPYRSLNRPLLRFLSELKRIEQADIVTVVVPEFVPDTWWEHILHGQSAQFIKLALLFTPGFVVTSVPSHHAPAKSST